MLMVSQQSSRGAPTLPPTAPPASRRSVLLQNKPSLLLTEVENQSVFKIIGNDRRTLSTAVAQLLVPTTDGSHWQRKGTGVACFVRDQEFKSYYIQVVSLGKGAQVLLDQEIYNEFEYEMPLPVFLTFEGDDTMISLNFADETEASHFRKILDAKLEARKPRTNARPLSNVSVCSVESLQQSTSAVDHGGSSSQLDERVTLRNQRTIPTGVPLRASPKKKGKKKGLRKEDIGNPLDFRHLYHVSFNAKKELVGSSGVDEDVQKFFKKAGVSREHLKDARTSRFIFDFIEQHGGVEAVKKEVSSTSQTETKPQPSTSLPVHGICDRKSPSRPPPPNPRPPPGLPVGEPATHNTSNLAPTSPATGAGGPPPPPPPPTMLAAGPSPPPPTMLAAGPSPPPPPNPGQLNLGTSGSSQGADSSALLRQIQDGISLKKVDLSEVQASKPSGGFSDVLDSICSGSIKLRPMQAREVSKAQASIEEGGGIAAALARALQSRSRAINPTDSESSGSEGDEELDDYGDEYDQEWLNA